MNHNSKKVIVSIDFGTSGTSYSYAFTDSKEDILSPEELKEPTEIILDSQMKCLKFGNDCKAFLCSEESHEKQYYHFSDIKMKLYKNQRKIQSNNDNTSHDLQMVISQVLKAIKEKALIMIKSKREEKSITESDIEWKVTVPAIWREKSKEIMINAAKSAGIFKEYKDDKSLFLALEPESAAFDYINEKSSDKNAVKIGNNYIICDIGGGTIDISTHTRKKDTITGKVYIEELYPPSGGNNGSSYINKLFVEKVLKSIFGGNAMNELLKAIKNNPIDEDIGYDDYINLLDQIEEFKTGINESSINNSKRINCSIFEQFVNDDISRLIEEYNNNCPEKWKIKSFKGFKIFFPYEIMIDLTKKTIVNNVVNYLYDIIDNVKNINSIIYTGTVAKNNFIISMIKNQLSSKINHYVATHPVLAVARGAVMFGMNPLIIKSRISRFNIGIQINEKWNEVKHGKREDLKYFCSIEKCYKCKKIFSPIISKNKRLSVEEWVSKYYIILGPNCIIDFLKTDYDDVIFTDDKTKKCEQFGEVYFDIGKEYDENDRDLIIELKLGGTFVDAKIIYKEVEKFIPLYFH